MDEFSTNSILLRHDMIIVTWEEGYYNFVFDQSVCKLIWRNPKKQTIRTLIRLDYKSVIERVSFYTITNKKYGISLQNSKGEELIFCAKTEEIRKQFLIDFQNSISSCNDWIQANKVLQHQCKILLDDLVDQSNSEFEDNVVQRFLTILDSCIYWKNRTGKQFSCLSKEMFENIPKIVSSSARLSQKLLGGDNDLARLDFNKDSMLGSGAFGKVYKAKWKLDNDEEISVAVKEINSELSPLVSGFDLVSLRRELSILRLMRHPNLLKYYGFTFSEPFYYIITELASCNLLQYITNNPSLKLSIKEYIIFQICNGLKELHRVEIAHRDIKSENILLVKIFFFLFTLTTNFLLTIF